MTPFGMWLEKLHRPRNLKKIELAEMVGIKSSYVSVCLNAAKKGCPRFGIQDTSHLVGTEKMHFKQKVYLRSDFLKLLLLREHIENGNYLVG